MQITMLLVRHFDFPFVEIQFSYDACNMDDRLTATCIYKLVHLAAEKKFRLLASFRYITCGEKGWERGLHNK